MLYWNYRLEICFRIKEIEDGFMGDLGVDEVRYMYLRNLRMGNWDGLEFKLFILLVGENLVFFIILLEFYLYLNLIFL